MSLLFFLSIKLFSQDKIYLPKYYHILSVLIFKNSLKDEENYSTNMEGANNITAGLLCKAKKILMCRCDDFRSNISK
ncbi:hypothetical protein LG21E20_13440 [Lactococcus formosensis]|nr:hypothetical protein LG21E20_13440 [Lactococcus formosensis]BDX25270.1 hypothetical protein LFMS200408A_13470 [Lactococcus formosensis]